MGEIRVSPKPATGSSVKRATRSVWIVFVLDGATVVTTSLHAEELEARRQAMADGLGRGVREVAWGSKIEGAS